MNKMDDFCCLVSGYRGVGKTTLVKSIEEDFMNEKGEDLNILFIKTLINMKVIHFYLES